MRFTFLILFLLVSFMAVSQEIGSVQNNGHFVKLLKSDNFYSLVYSDVKPDSYNVERSFYFSNKDTLYTILMNGFNSKKGHQLIVKTNKDTIVKFNFRKLNGEYQLYVYQNNLNNKTFGRSSFFTKNQVIKLFGKQLKE